MGTAQMRSPTAIPHDRIKYDPDYMKAAGCCSNVRKTDYNIGGRDDEECCDSIRLNSKTRQQNQTSCQAINLVDSHESGEVALKTESTVPGTRA
jgi:hypothetical protein